MKDHIVMGDSCRVSKATDFDDNDHDDDELDDVLTESELDDLL